jgi:phosphatidylcholine synthase
MKREKFLAWCVHFYTAMGLLAAALIAVLIVRGGDASFRQAFRLMILATFIDSTDGWLARRARVKQILPGFDGRKLDDIVDFLNYTSLPLLLLWRAGLLEGGYAWWLLLPLLASAYGFSQVDAKTADGFFLGFPSYWNVVALYLYLLRPPDWPALLIIISTRYLYPSQRAPFSKLTIILCALWALLLIFILTGVVLESRWPVLLSLIFPIYYMLLSWAITLRLRTRGV